MTVILENYTISDVGVFEIRQPVNLTISAAAARRSVTHWLVFDVTMMLAGEEPPLVIGTRGRAGKCRLSLAHPVPVGSVPLAWLK